MNRKQFRTTVNAPREKVWNILWGNNTYPRWTAAFTEGSKVVTDWQEGSKVLFLNAKNEGMVSRIQEKKENERMVFVHLGMVDKDGKEDTFSEEVKSWGNAEEIYTLKSSNGKTEVIVEMDLGEAHEEYFNSAWPKAFQELKRLAESEK